jgi:CRISPR-associated endonuclease/helicase Cas3
MEVLLALPTINQRLARTIGHQELDAITCSRLTALVFLHDIGKANRGFQARWDPGAPIIGHIDQLAWVLTDVNAEVPRARLFDVLGLADMNDWITEETGFEIWAAIMAHHGRPWRARESSTHWEPIDGSDPIADLAIMRTHLRSWFSKAFEPAPPIQNTPAFDHAFAGLVMLADWLGSDTEFFPFACGSEPDRMAFARPQATLAVQRVGLAVEQRRAVVRTNAPDFAHLFSVPHPRAIQIRAIEPNAACVILEAETGSGKTEAALWRFVHLFRVGAVDGIYFALPTRVAATQMFTRIKRLRDALFPVEDRPVVVLAVPGQVAADEASGHILPDFGFEWDDVPTEQQRAGRWAAEHPKRFLAAQIAVGTIDQVLLGSIATRHAHLRATMLLRHLVVVDEVHASDRFMEELLGNLLRGHLHAGGHALLLSATLGAGAQARLLGVKQRSLPEAEAAPYPAFSWAEAGQARMLSVPAAGVGKTVQISTQPWLDAPDQIAALARAAADRGAKVLVIRNTVTAAIATTRALEAGGDRHLFRVAGNATLHHGRFGTGDRRMLDAAVEDVLGRDSARDPAIVVGTQTLEQSLDLDADLLITDLCPMDVLLQRIGRLHRHARARPTGFETPCVTVLTPRNRDLLKLLRGRSGRHGLGQVYPDARIIEATWRLIETDSVWHIPAMNRKLVERATHPEVMAAIEAQLNSADPGWSNVLNDIFAKTIVQRQTAGTALLDRAAPFSAFQLPADDQWGTRLGAKDLLVKLDGLIGPFGIPVGSLRIPQFLAGGAAADAAAIILENNSLLIRLKIGANALIYDRWGLRAESA